MMQPAVKEIFIKQIDMMVAAKILQLVSSGIYRTPANALKELVSNSFDADATRVDIQINILKGSDRIDEIVIKDNGLGINPSDFAFSMSHVGASLKRIEGDRTRMGRPIIGRIGIGLLSVGEAANKFEFLSATPNGVGMRAEVDLSPYYNAITMTESLDTLKIGNIRLYQFEEPSRVPYTRITLGTLREPFVRALIGKDGYKKNYDFTQNPSYESFVEWIDKNEIERLNKVSPFNQFMFELGLLTPVRYLPDGPIRGAKTPITTDIKRRLENYDFHLFVNSVEVFKPILFPHMCDLKSLGKEPYKVYEKDFDIEFDNRKLIAKCYYYHQDVRIIPFELRGLLLRVKNVGIGTYENTFSKIPSESPVILHQLTGELYVDEGLDTALNIDRNSFFESDEAYQRLWLEVLAWVNPEQLPTEAIRYVKPAQHSVSSDIRRRLDTIRKGKKDERNARARESLRGKLGRIVSRGGYPAKSPPELEVVVDSKSKLQASIRCENNMTFVTAVFDRKYSENVQNVLVILLTAQRIALQISKGSPEEFENAFSEILKGTSID